MTGPGNQARLLQQINNLDQWSPSVYWFIWKCGRLLAKSILKSVGWMLGRVSKNAFWNWLVLLTNLSLYSFLNDYDDHSNPINQLLVMLLFCIRFFYSSHFCLSPAFLKAAYSKSHWCQQGVMTTMDFLFALKTVHNSSANLISHIIYYKTSLLTWISPSLISLFSLHLQGIPVSFLSVHTMKGRSALLSMTLVWVC